MTVGELNNLVSLRHDIDVLIPLDGVTLEGLLSAPREAKSVVLFAHGSGSSRFNPRNHYVAEELYQCGHATLLTDLLTPEEEKDEMGKGRIQLNIGLLAERLFAITEWVKRHDKIGNRPIGLFGSSTGAASALVVAALRPRTIQAVVSRGGRPDLAGKFLERVTAPTLLIVGGHDREFLRINKKALAQLNTYSRLEVVPDATHLFGEEGTLEEVARLTVQWFDEHLRDKEHEHAEYYEAEA